MIQKWDVEIVEHVLHLITSINQYITFIINNNSQIKNHYLLGKNDKYKGLFHIIAHDITFSKIATLLHFRNIYNF